MKNRFARTAVAAVAFALLSATFASAQATRTWVSGVGDDVNPCSRTAPCKTFAGAISKTAAGGEISVLDPGGFGTLTITKSITINGEGFNASVLGSGTNGITINAGVNDVVTLLHLQINGAGSGLIGVRQLAGGTLVIDDVRISGFETGVEVNSGNTSLLDSIISNNRVVGLHAKGGVLLADGNMIVSNNVAVMATAPGTLRLSDNGMYSNLTGYGCGGGTLASAGNNRKAGNSGGVVSTCAPTVVITVQ